MTIADMAVEAARLYRFQLEGKYISRFVENLRRFGLAEEFIREHMTYSWLSVNNTQSFNLEQPERGRSRVVQPADGAHMLVPRIRHDPNRNLRVECCGAMNDNDSW